MDLDVVTLGNEVLREKAKPVETFDQALEDTVRQMIVLMREKKGVGLAAPQVGISRRFLTSQETVNGEEGCLSLPGVWANVARPYSVKVQAQDTTGKIFHLNAEGWLARIILHENDHLNGLLFVDRLPQNIKNKVISKYEKMSHNK